MTRLEISYIIYKYAIYLGWYIPTQVYKLDFMINHKEISHMTVIDKITDMVNTHISRAIHKLPHASPTTCGTLLVDDRTLKIEDTTIVVQDDQVTPSNVVVSTPITPYGYNDAVYIYKNSDHLEIELSSRSLLPQPINISHMTLFIGNDVIDVATIDGTCSLCYLDKTITGFEAVAIDIEGHRSLTTYISIKYIPATIHPLKITAPSTDVVTSKLPIPYAIDNIVSTPTIDGYTLYWELSNGDSDVLWEGTSVYPSVSIYGPAGNTIKNIQKSDEYDISIIDTLDIQATHVTMFNGNMYYLTSNQGCIYNHTTSECINIPSMRYVFTIKSSDKILVATSALYTIYTTDGITWYTVEHNTSIVDMCMYDDVIYLLTSSGDVYRYNTVTRSYLDIIHTDTADVMSISVDDLSMYILGAHIVNVIDRKSRDRTTILTDLPIGYKHIYTIGNMITMVASRSIMYFDRIWKQLDITDGYVVSSNIHTDKLIITTSAGYVYIFDHTTKLTKVQITHTPLLDIIVTNTGGYITDGDRVYTIKKLVHLSKPVILSVKCVATDAKYSISDIATKTYRYRIE